MVSRQVVVAEDHEQATESKMGSPTLSQMLFNRKPLHATFQYRVNARRSYGVMPHAQHESPASPLLAQDGIPKTPGSAPPARIIGRSGTKSLGMRHRLRSVENSASPCLRQKRTAGHFRDNMTGKKLKPVTSTMESSASMSDVPDSIPINQDSRTSSGKDSSIFPEPVPDSRKKTCQSSCKSPITHKRLGTQPLSTNSTINESEQSTKKLEIILAEVEENITANSTYVKSTMQDIKFEQKLTATDLDTCGEDPNTEIENPSTEGFKTASNKNIPIPQRTLDGAVSLMEKIWTEKKKVVPNLSCDAGVKPDSRTTMCAEKRMDAIAVTVKLPIKEAGCSLNASIDPSSESISTSPVLRNRRTFRKRLKRRKIPTMETITAAVLNDDSKLDTISAADSSFLSDGLDIELLAVDLNVRFNEDCDEATKILCDADQPSPTDNKVTVPSDIAANSPKSDAMNLQSPKQSSPNHNLKTATSVSKSVPVVPRQTLLETSSLDFLQTFERLPSKNATMGTEENSTVHSSCPLLDQNNSDKNGASLCSSMPLPMMQSGQLLHLGSKISVFEPSRTNDDAGETLKSSPPGLVKHVSTDDDGMNSDDDLLVRAGAELEGQVTGTVAEKLPRSSDKNATDPSIFMGFATASKKEIRISNAAMNKAKMLFMNLEKEEGKQGNKTPAAHQGEETVTELTPPKNFVKNKFSGFQTASNKPVVISEAAMARAKTFLAEEDKATDGHDKPMKSKELTACTKEISASETPGIKALTNLFKAVSSHIGRKKNKEFKTPRPAECSAKNMSEEESALKKDNPSEHNSNNEKTLTPNKKILGVKHIGDSQITVSDESLVKAMEMFEDVFS